MAGIRLEEVGCVRTSEGDGVEAQGLLAIAGDGEHLGLAGGIGLLAGEGQRVRRERDRGAGNSLLARRNAESEGARASDGEWGAGDFDEVTGLRIDGKAAELIGLSAVTILIGTGRIGKE